MVVSEDWAFFEHNGADFLQIWRAFRDFATGSSRLRGASTITQQVAKNVFLSHERSVWRKVKEYFVGREIEEALSKNEILEIYLNIVEWGDGIVGIQQAAQRYFDKDASVLTPKEAAFLAYLLPSPVRYSRVFRDRELTRYSSKRISQVLLGMLQAHYITQEVYQIERRAKLSFEKSDSLEEVIDDDGSIEDDTFEEEVVEDDTKDQEADLTQPEEIAPSEEEESVEELLEESEVQAIEQSFEDPSQVAE